jgi:hypothetical protein
MTMTRETKTTVLPVPMIERMTSMFGRERAGPARSRARAGPLPMPLPMRPCRMGTSVNVAKYMKAPANEATKLDMRELPPTAVDTHDEGISPSSPGGRGGGRR